MKDVKVSEILGKHTERAEQCDDTNFPTGLHQNETMLANTSATKPECPHESVIAMPVRRRDDTRMPAQLGAVCDTATIHPEFGVRPEIRDSSWNTGLTGYGALARLDRDATEGNALIPSCSNDHTTLIQQKLAKTFPNNGRGCMYARFVINPSPSDATLLLTTFSSRLPRCTLPTGHCQLLKPSCFSSANAMHTNRHISCARSSQEHFAILLTVATRALEGAVASDEWHRHAVFR